MGHERTLAHSFRFSSHASCPIAHACLKRMGAVRADGELQLEEELVDRTEIAVLRPPQLSSQLAELRWPERQRCAHSFVAPGRVVVGAIEAHAGEPALAELVVERCVES